MCHEVLITGELGILIFSSTAGQQNDPSGCCRGTYLGSGSLKPLLAPAAQIEAEPEAAPGTSSPDWKREPEAAPGTSSPDWKREPEAAPGTSSPDWKREPEAAPGTSSPDWKREPGPTPGTGSPDWK